MSQQVIHDTAAEAATLGGCLLSKTVANEVVEILRPPDFYSPRHETIFEAIVALVAAGRPVDVISVADLLLHQEKLTQAGGPEYLHGLTSAVSTAVQAPYYADIVHQKAVRRRVVEASVITARNAETMDIGDLLDGARKRIDDAAGLQRQSLVYVGDLIEKVVADAERPRRVNAGPWGSVNDTLGGGFRPGALYVVAARPGIGKTAIALQIAASLAAAGPVAFISLEMPREEITRRIIAQGVGMPHALLEKGQPLPEYWKKRITDWSLDGAPHNIAMDDRANLHMSDARSFARAVQRPSTRKLGGVVIDYLQLMGGPAGQSRYEIVSENSRQAKVMGMELECPVILLSQLNRNSEGRVDKRPGLHDLRDSGAIEQDADVVAMLYRDPEFEQPMGGVPLPVPLEFNVAKNRHGPTMNHTLLWEGTQMRAYDSREER